ncbi:NACHT domain-containing protein [Pseudonocardiaceae bacterium YIM PH 21723]|nr:NACHT domain-containing protein [Pseudonocardiaceae bacterium YIM PH 21723]
MNERSANQVSGVVNGGSFQAGQIHGPVNVYLGAERASAQFPVDPPEGWADRPDLPAAVLDLLRAQVCIAEDMPYQLPGAARPSLDTVYVRQELAFGATDGEPEQARPTPILDERGQLVGQSSVPVVRLAVRPPSRTVADVLAADDHLVITGGPGQGKSTLSLRLAAELAERWQSDAVDTPLPEPVIPLRLTARELATHLSLPFPQALANSVRGDYGAFLTSTVDTSSFTHRVAGCRWLLLIDGLDEVADPGDRAQLVKALAIRANTPDSPYRILLTTRPNEGGALAPLERLGAARFELQPFDQEALDRFAANWFDSGDETYRFIRQIRAAHLDELVRVPLLATIAAIIFGLRTDKALPDNQYELYEAYLKYLRLNRADSPRFDRWREPLLEHLGRVRLEADTSLVQAVRDWIPAQDANPDELIDYLITIGPLVRRNNDLRFLHHSFAEHLAATAKARLLPQPFDAEHPEFATLLHAAKPRDEGKYARSVLVHYTRLHPEQADRLLTWLHEGGADQHLLAARLLADHLPASVPAVDSFLDKVRSWAMTTQWPGLAVLARTSRAAHHPGLPAWLAAFMRDTTAPWASRIEAATALAARLHGEATAEAADLLCAVARDASLAIGHRLDAAEALADCGTRHRQACVDGLRGVLADPLASAANCRSAAVVLAGFPDTRQAASEALVAMLDDPWMPDDDLVEIATGLVEIDVQHHERCAEVFRSILLRSSRMYSVPQDAAVGLASLGPKHADEAVALLTAAITDRRRTDYHRISAATALAKLGQQHRITAAAHLRALGDSPGLAIMDRTNLADAFATIGLPDESAAEAHRVLLDERSNVIERYWVAYRLAGLGPAHRADAARVLTASSADVCLNPITRAQALGELAKLGGQHRVLAVARLRDWATDLSADQEPRCHAASQLAQLDSAHHGEVVDLLYAIARGQGDLGVRLTAWQRLRSLNFEITDEAVSTITEALATPDYVAAGLDRGSWFSFGSSPDGHRRLADNLLSVLKDPHRCGADRLCSAGVLLRLHRRYHPVATQAMMDLLSSGGVPISELTRLADRFQTVSAHGRAELAAAISAQSLRSDGSAQGLLDGAEAVNTLGHPLEPSHVSALRVLLADELEPSSVRRRAAMLLARTAPEELTSLARTASVLIGLEGDDSDLEPMIAAGADVSDLLTTLATGSDEHWQRRRTCAILLRKWWPVTGTAVLSPLRNMAEDVYLDPAGRTVTWQELIKVDGNATSPALEFHLALFADETQDVADRCIAARELVRLGSSTSDAALAFLRRCAIDRSVCWLDRWYAIASLSWILPRTSSELVTLWTALAVDTESTVNARKAAVERLPERESDCVRLPLLADRTARPGNRVKSITRWRHSTLADQAETVLRDVLTAVESSPAERVSAAVALASLDPRQIPESARLLRELTAVPGGGNAARLALAGLSRRWRHTVLEEALATLEEDKASWRRRLEAIDLIVDLEVDQLPGPFIDCARLAIDEGLIRGRSLVDVRYGLRTVDGLHPVRQLRDDERLSPSIRHAAALKLRNHDFVDRTAGFQVLRTIVHDRGCRPALRCRAAWDLFDFGDEGRELAIGVLHELLLDDRLSARIRIAAASNLATVVPVMHAEVLRVLRGFLSSTPPATRISAYAAMRHLDRFEACCGLRQIAQDWEVSPRLRLRAARKMTNLRRDFREPAAMVAREIANHAAVPTYLRKAAARELCRWSDICRAEGQAILRELS